jgi:hypothetical protein
VNETTQLVVAGVVLLGLIAALLQAGTAVLERIACTGLALTGVVGLLVALSRSIPVVGQPSGDAGAPLLAAALAFGCLAVVATYRPKR